MQIFTSPAFLHFVPLFAIGYLVAANLLGFGLIALDRRGQARGESGVSESLILLVAAFGGWIGAKLGQLVFAGRNTRSAFGKMLNASGLLIPVWVFAGFALAADKTELYATIGEKFAVAMDSKTYFSDSGSTTSTGTAASVKPKRFGPGSGN